MLILEIVLTILAYRQGWRGWALLPGAFIIGYCFLLGLTQIPGRGLLGYSADCSCVLALIVLLIVGRKLFE